MEKFMVVRTGIDTFEVYRRRMLVFWRWYSVHKTLQDAIYCILCEGEMSFIYDADYESRLSAYEA